MSRGKRYSGERRLNLKKVFAVIITFIVIIMACIGIRKILSKDKSEKITSLSYYAAYEDNKYGVINSNGEVIIQPAYQELIIVPNENKDVFLCTYDVDYENNTYKTKALNSKNEEIYTDFDDIEPIINKDLNNNISYNSDILKVKKDEKYGLISIDGKTVLPCEYDEIKALEGNENSIIVKKDEKVGLVDNNGKKVVDIKYKGISKLSDNYQNGYIVESDQGKYGTVDCANNTVLEAKYDEIKPVYNNGMYVVKLNKGYNVVDKTGKVVLTKEYEDIKNLKNSQVIVKENEKYGVVSTNNEQILPCSYQNISFCYLNSYIFENDNKYGIINSNGEVKIENKFKNINYIEEGDIIEATEDGINSILFDSNFSEKINGIISLIDVKKGYIKVINSENEYKYYNFKFEEQSEVSLFPKHTMYLSKKNGKYGYLDAQGNVIVDYIYDDAKEQNNLGYAAVKKDGKWGSLDQKGNLSANIENSLEDYTEINFIGKWHLMKDQNINCYTK